MLYIKLLKNASCVHFRPKKQKLKNIFQLNILIKSHHFKICWEHVTKLHS